MSPGTTTLSQFAGQAHRPVLVGGCPRSGTTLLRSMLDSHPSLAIPRETRFVIESWDRRPAFGDLKEAENRRRLAKWIFNRKKTWSDRLGLDPEQAVEHLVQAPPTLGSLLATGFAMHAERHGKPRWGDKRPTYAARMEVIWSLFPNAQFVNVIRDPRACAASMRKLGWYKGSVVPAVEIWLRSIRTVDSWRRRLAADQLLDTRFEDLVADPEDELIRIAEFAGLTVGDAELEEMLRYHERKETRSERYHANVSRPPDTTRLSAWSDVLEPGEIAFIEEATRPLLLEHTYEPAAEGVSPPRDLIRELAALQRRWTVRRLKLRTKERARTLVLHRHPLAAVPAGERPTRAAPSLSAPVPPRDR
ncbi:MAG: sulfotransferase family protein [Gaiellaceae bacterium]